jgi:low affinity Fe/Cu permease
MNEGASSFGIIVFVIIGICFTLSTKTLMFILLYILLPIVGLIVITGLVVMLIQGLKNKNKKALEDNKDNK